MSASAEEPPSWLTRAVSDVDYLRHVFRELKKRDGIRYEVMMKKKAGQGGSTEDNDATIANSALENDPLFRHYSAVVGTSKKNYDMNIYGLKGAAYDRTRVTTEQYFSANWVRELHGGHWWIATQEPIRGATLYAFFSIFMHPINRPAHLDSLDVHKCAQHSLRTIVQLNIPLEEGYRSIYGLPKEPKQSQHITGTDGRAIRVTMVERKQVKPYCIRSVLRLVNLKPIEANRPANDDSEEAGKPTYIRHLHYQGWNDLSSPSVMADFVAFAKYATEVNRKAPYSHSPMTNFEPEPPMVVHCTAGVGRTGTFISACSLLRAHGKLPGLSSKGSKLPSLPRSPLGALPDNLEADEVATEVDSLREQRQRMVESGPQLRFLYVMLHDEVYVAPGPSISSPKSVNTPTKGPRSISSRPSSPSRPEKKLPGSGSKSASSSSKR